MLPLSLLCCQPANVNYAVSELLVHYRPRIDSAIVPGLSLPCNPLHLMAVTRVPKEPEKQEHPGLYK